MQKTRQSHPAGIFPVENPQRHTHTEVSRSSQGPLALLVSIGFQEVLWFPETLSWYHLSHSQYQAWLRMLGDKGQMLWGPYYLTLKNYWKSWKNSEMTAARDGGHTWQWARPARGAGVRKLYSQQGQTPPYPLEMEPLEKENQGFNAHKRHSGH